MDWWSEQWRREDGLLANLFWFIVIAINIGAIVGPAVMAAVAVSFIVPVERWFAVLACRHQSSGGLRCSNRRGALDFNGAQCVLFAGHGGDHALGPPRPAGRGPAARDDPAAGRCLERPSNRFLP